MRTQGALTRAQVRRVDELAVKELGIPSIVLMENAGRNAAEIVLSFALGTAPGGGKVGPLSGTGRFVVFAGPGNNGGDGFVVARHLANEVRAPVIAWLCGERAKLTPDAATNLAIVERMGMAVGDVSTPDAIRAATSALRDHDIVLDALLGTGFSGEVREPTSTLIDALNRARKRAMVAIDLPSGLDCDTGRPSNATIRATLTITFVAPKVGFAAPGAAEWTGDIEVADIGAPASLVDRVRS